MYVEPGPILNATPVVNRSILPLLVNVPFTVTFPSIESVLEGMFRLINSPPTFTTKSAIKAVLTLIEIVLPLTMVTDSPDNGMCPKLHIAGLFQLPVPGTEKLICDITVRGQVKITNRIKTIFRKVMEPENRAD